MIFLLNFFIRLLDTAVFRFVIFFIYPPSKLAPGAMH